jgi:hypothetical protein
MAHNPNYAPDSEIANRILIILTEKLPAGATSKWISYVYSQQYGEIPTQKIVCILESLHADGYLTQHDPHSRKQKRVFSKVDASASPGTDP